MKSGKKDIFYYLGLSFSHLAVAILLLLNTGFINLDIDLDSENKTEKNQKSEKKQDKSEDTQTIVKEASFEALIPLGALNLHPNLPFISAFNFPMIQQTVPVYEQFDTLSPYFEVVLQFIISINAP